MYFIERNREILHHVPEHKHFIISVIQQEFGCPEYDTMLINGPAFQCPD